MIIVEGLDNSGKSTLIQQLSEQFKLPTAHAHRSSALELKSISEWHCWAAACPKPIILDRHPAISDLVYGPIIRSSTVTTIELAEHYRKDHYLIFCCPTLETIRATYEDRDQMKGTHQNLNDLYHEYLDVMMTLEPDFVYDFVNPRSYAALVTNLTSAIQRMK